MSPTTCPPLPKQIKYESLPDFIKDAIDREVKAEAEKQFEIAWSELLCRFLPYPTGNLTSKDCDDCEFIFNQDESPSHLRVLGNIYENPELLNEKED